MLKEELGIVSDDEMDLDIKGDTVSEELNTKCRKAMVRMKQLMWVSLGEKM
jgi:hypothetical protein